MDQNKRFKDHVCLVTGAASGIGLATVQLFAAEGAKVVLNDISRETVTAAAAALQRTGADVRALVCDVADTDAVDAMVAAAVGAFGKIDVLINNAGFGYSAPALDHAEWNRIIAVNLTGAFFVSTAVARSAMIPQRRGVIVNNASIAGLAGHAGGVGYVASKHGVVGLTKALAVEWAQYGIRVNCVCPGATETPVFRTLPEEKVKERSARIPLGKVAQPSEQANVIAFLASEAAAAVTGAIVPVDGGQMALSSGWLPPHVPALD